MILQSKKPLFEQIADFFLEMIHKGVYPPGSMLPSVRDVAIQEKVNPNTVVRAYSLLEERKAILAIPKKGYFVSEAKEGEDELGKALSLLLSKGYRKEDIAAKLNELTANDETNDKRKEEEGK